MKQNFSAKRWQIYIYDQGHKTQCLRSPKDNKHNCNGPLKIEVIWDVFALSKNITADHLFVALWAQWCLNYWYFKIEQ